MIYEGHLSEGVNDARGQHPYRCLEEAHQDGHLGGPVLDHQHDVVRGVGVDPAVAKDVLATAVQNSVPGMDGKKVNVHLDVEFISITGSRLRP